jgi:hypothetical protein
VRTPGVLTALFCRADASPRADEIVSDNEWLVGQATGERAAISRAEGENNCVTLGRVIPGDASGGTCRTNQIVQRAGGQVGEFGYIQVAAYVSYRH